MLTIFIVQLIGLISPGPDFFYVCRKAMADSRRSALLGSLGISLGVGFWSLVVLFGLAFLNRTLPHFQYYLMLLGGSYLAYNGIKMLQIRQSANIEEKVTRSIERAAWQEILAGLMINLSNPKVVIFFSSVLAGYVSNLSAINDILLVLTMLMGSALVWFWLVAILFSQQNIRSFYSRYNRYVDNLAGLIFMLFGLKLIYDGLLTLLG